MTFTSMEDEGTAKIRVIGVGGAGGNALNNMIDSNLQGIQFVAANTDNQALAISKAEIKIQLGEKITGGLGAGANPDVGREAALENAAAIRDALEGSHMVFITAGFGGGTGTGAAPVIAKICKEIGALTVAVVSRPFFFEGSKRSSMATVGINALKDITDTVITIPNDRLRGYAPKDATMVEMFKRADGVLHDSVKGITDLIMIPGLINLDFADVRTIMSKAGLAIIGIGVGTGENRAIEAAERAISHPLLDDIPVAGAKGILLNITSNKSLTMEEMSEASERIHSEVGEDAEIIWGTAIDESIQDEIRITVIATGINYPGSEPLGKHASNIETRAHYGRTKPLKKYGDFPARGKIRELSMEERERGVTSSPFSYSKAAGESGGSYYKGYKGIVLDDGSLEVPTFLRRKAD
ncbi:MAG TPA: cell division protein FtsZ [Desulfobacteraceae bacterium]|nr:cell division protein FtsZ [Desulfobacteraceae bacterium]